MKRMSVITIVIAAAVIVAAGTIVICGLSRKKADGILDGDGMVNPRAIALFSYQRGGGMLGAYYNIGLKDDKLTVERCEGNGGKTYKKTYTVPDEIIDNIENIISESGMRDWNSELPDKDYFVLDGETTSVSIYFADGAEVSFSSDLVVPDGGWEAVKEVVRLLENIADK